MIANFCSLQYNSLWASHQIMEKSRASYKGELCVEMQLWYNITKYIAEARKEMWAGMGDSLNDSVRE